MLILLVEKGIVYPVIWIKGVALLTLNFGVVVMPLIVCVLSVLKDLLERRGLK